MNKITQSSQFMLLYPSNFPQFQSQKGIYEPQEILHIGRSLNNHLVQHCLEWCSFWCRDNLHQIFNCKMLTPGVWNYTRSAKSYIRKKESFMGLWLPSWRQGSHRQTTSKGTQLYTNKTLSGVTLFRPELIQEPYVCWPLPYTRIWSILLSYNLKFSELWRMSSPKKSGTLEFMSVICVFWGFLCQCLARLLKFCSLTGLSQSKVNLGSTFNRVQACWPAVNTWNGSNCTGGFVCIFPVGKEGESTIWEPTCGGPRTTCQSWSCLISGHRAWWQVHLLAESFHRPVATSAYVHLLS